jgi:hypothetical protein
MSLNKLQIVQIMVARGHTGFCKQKGDGNMSHLVWNKKTLLENTHESSISWSLNKSEKTTLRKATLCELIWVTTYCKQLPVNTQHPNQRKMGLSSAEDLNEAVPYVH